MLLNLVPGRWFLRVSLFVQAALFIATVGALPLFGRQPQSAAWWPPVWFLRLWEAMVTGRASARPALLAIVLPPVLAVLAYLLSYHRYRKLLLEAPADRAGGQWSGWGSRLLERWIRNPREQAAFAFTWKTLSRSPIHRLLLLAYAGLALGWVIKAALDAPPVALHDEGMYGLMAVASPLGLAVLMILALRYLFSLPVTLQANWMFQTADQEGRDAWQAAVQRFVIACGIVPVYLASLPASIAILGWLRALAVTALGVLVALLCFERLFRDWRKLPFTCSYLPGKQMVWLLLFRYSVAMIYFAAIPPLLLSASGELGCFPRALHRAGSSLAAMARQASRAVDGKRHTLGRVARGRRHGAAPGVRRTGCVPHFHAAARARDVLRRDGGLSRTPAAGLGRRDRRRPARLPRFCWPRSGKTCATAAA